MLSSYVKSSNSSTLQLEKDSGDAPLLNGSPTEHQHAKDFLPQIPSPASDSGIVPAPTEVDTKPLPVKRPREKRVSERDRKRIAARTDGAATQLPKEQPEMVVGLAPETREQAAERMERFRNGEKPLPANRPNDAKPIKLAPAISHIVNRPRAAAPSQVEVAASYEDQMERKFVEGSGHDRDLHFLNTRTVYDRGGWEPNYAMEQEVRVFWQTRQPFSFLATLMISQEDGTDWQGRPQNPIIDRKTGKTAKYMTLKSNGAKPLMPSIPMGVWRKMCDRYQLKTEDIWLSELVKAAQNHELPALFQVWSRAGEKTKEQDDSPNTNGFGTSGFLITTHQKALGKLQASLSPGTQELSLLQQGTLSQALLPALCSFVQNLPSRARVPSFWKYVELHPEIPIEITEGWGKSGALISQGYVAIALLGINTGVQANAKIDGIVTPLEKRRLIADIARFAIPGRQVRLWFDQDDKQVTRDKVTSASFTLGALLKAAGSSVTIVTWEPSQGKGADDLIVNCGAAAAEDAIAAALTFDQWAIGHKLSRRVKRKATIDIGDREFSEVADVLPEDQDIAFWGGKGSGKSKGISALLKGENWLSLTSSISLGRDQARGWDGVFFNDGDRYGNKLLRNGKIVLGGSICIPSLMKVREVFAGVLVIDEVSAVLRFLITSSLCNKDGIRSVLLSEFDRRIREAKRVIIADADLDEEVLQYIERIRGTRFCLVHSHRQPLKWVANTFNKRQEAIAALIDQVEAAKDGKIFYVNFDEKRAATSLATVLEAKGIKCLLITQDTSGGEVEQAFMGGKGSDLPALRMMGVRVIISSPTISQGFSIEQNTELIDSVWGIYAGTSITADSMAQALDRVRDMMPRYLHVAQRGRAYSKHSGAFNQDEFIRELKSSSSAAARIARVSLRPEICADVDTTDWQGENIKMLAHFETSRNEDMASLRDSVYSRLRHEGKTITPYATKISAKRAKEVGRLMREAGAAADVAWQIAVSGAQSLNEDEIKALEQKQKSQSLTQSELQSLCKYYVRQFYRLEDVSADDVAFDAKGRTRKQTRRLEAFIDPAIARKQVTDSIEASSKTAWDWSKVELLITMVNDCGLGQLIRQILDKQVTVLDGEQRNKIAIYLRTNSKQWKAVGGNKADGDISNQQIVGSALELFGIRTTKHSVRQGEDVIREYRVDDSHLDKMVNLLKRRAESVTPLDKLDELHQIDRGATAPIDPDISRWLDPESLQNIRVWHENADTCPEIRESLNEVPACILKKALAS